LRGSKIGGAVYILPNLLTTGNLFFGYFSIIKSIQGDFIWATAALLLSAIFDVLDGRIARLTNGTSDFGVQYDSLSDLVSFGLATAFLMYLYSLQHLGRIGWILCFIFAACGALRLARFNVQSSIGQASGDFTGLPIPMAAGVVACCIGFLVDLETQPEESIWFLETIYEFLRSPRVQVMIIATLAPLLAFLMVSNIAYRSHKSFKVSNVKTFRLLALLVAIIGLVAYRPLLAGFVFFFGYMLSGPIEWVLGWKKARDDDEIFGSLEDSASVMEPGPDSDGDLHD
jgi:CDP-diacylglycerol--serine O-phosphatidyltransferase